MEEHLKRKESITESLMVILPSSVIPNAGGWFDK